MGVRQQQATATAGPPPGQQPPALRPGANVMALGRPGEGEAGRGHRGKAAGSTNVGKSSKGQQQQRPGAGGPQAEGSGHTRQRTASQSADQGTSQESVQQSGGSSSDVAEDRPANQRGRSSSRTTAALIGPSRTTAGSARPAGGAVGGSSRPAGGAVGGSSRPAGTSISTSGGGGQSATVRVTANSSKGSGASAKVTGASAKVTGASAKVTSSQSSNPPQNPTTQAGPSPQASVGQSRTTAALVGAGTSVSNSSGTQTPAGQGQSGNQGGRARSNSPKKSSHVSGTAQSGHRGGVRVASPEGQRRRHGVEGHQHAASPSTSRAAGSSQAAPAEVQAATGLETTGTSATTQTPAPRSSSAAPRPSQAQSSSSRTNQPQPSTSSGRPGHGSSTNPRLNASSSGTTSAPLPGSQKARIAAQHRPGGTGHNYSRIHQRIMGFSPVSSSSHGHSRFRSRNQQNACTQTPPANSAPLAPAESSPAVDPATLNVDILDGPSQQRDNSELQTHRLQPGTHQGRPEVNGALPDLLNSHALPPYDQPPRQNQRRPPHHAVPRSARRRAPSHGTTQLEEPSSPSCCNRWCYMRCVTCLTTFRYFLLGLAVFGVLIVITGIVLGVLNMTLGMNFLTLSLTLTGFGVVLVLVVGVCCKATPRNHEPCHLLFGLGEFAPQVGEVPPNGILATSRHRRDRNWHGGVVYQEFQHRRPPPSYFASMQEYHLNLTRARIELQNQQPPPVMDPSNENNGDDYSLPSSPPPTYKSRASTIRPGLHITFPPTEAGDSSSRPPTYRSHAGTLRRPSLELSAVPVEFESREPPGSGGSTMHRVNRVVEYLEGVIDSQQIETANNPAPAAASAGVQREGSSAVAADTQL